MEQLLGLIIIICIQQVLRNTPQSGRCCTRHGKEQPYHKGYATEVSSMCQFTVLKRVLWYLCASQSFSKSDLNHSFCRILLHSNNKVHNSISIPQVKPLGEHPVSTAKEHDV